MKNHCGSHSDARGEEKWLYAITLSLAFFPVVWVSTGRIFAAENLPSLSVNLMAPCSQDVAPKPI